ncbi:MAG: helix-turn-helix transcriptional regulator [Ruminiclostridium sp.]|nr:helix-turn-helix transcriptional regulator [Ruminiclostridium sp.]
MTFGEKLSQLRKESNYTQEQLGELLSVSRQTVSKWESDIAYPETDKLVKMGTLLGCSMDYLLKDEVTDKNSTAPVPPASQQEENSITIKFGNLRIKERKSEKTVFGMPLYHIGKNAEGFFAVGVRAKGVFSVGLLSKGIFSLGLLSMGLISFGMLSLGLVALGTFALGLIGIGAIALGLFAVGAISIGVVSVGALSFGLFSLGAMARGIFIAIGDNAGAMLAIGKTEAFGSVYQHIGELKDANLPLIRLLLETDVPAFLGWARDIFCAIAGI